MDADNEHKADDSDDGWMLDFEYTAEKQSEIVSESDGSTAVSTVKMWDIFIMFFFLHRPTLTLPPKLLGLGEATRSEPLGKKSVKATSAGVLFRAFLKEGFGCTFI